jgi:RHS repeat-associated protein
MVHADHLNRPIRMTSAAKATVWSAMWKPFGEPQALSGTIENNLRFPGQYFLIETNQAYNWHRTYDPTTGRYTQPDPLRFVDGPSVYGYVGGSPYMTVDGIGLETTIFIHSPVGWKGSSFGHVGTDINGTTYSWGPDGMAILPTDDYLDKNGFRNTYGFPIKLSPDEERILEAFLKEYPSDHSYDEFFANCGDPIEAGLENLGYPMGLNLLPVDIPANLFATGLADPSDEVVYPADPNRRRPWWYPNAPWAVFGAP